jgi:hypothetical protein
MTDYEALAKAAGWTFMRQTRYRAPDYKETYEVEYWFRHPKDGEWKRNADGTYAGERANGALDPEYVTVDTAKEACEKDGLA